MRRKRILWIGAILMGLLLVAAVTVTSVLRSQWFYEKVRVKLVSAVETATGGRVEIGALQLDWKRLRAEVSQFTLHGTEPAGKPPLLHVSSAAVGLKILSVLRQDVDIQYLDVQSPHIYLIIYPDGRTNVPEPKIKSRTNKNAAETILDLAIRRFNIQDGLFEVESRSTTPFSARGERLAARFDYELLGPRYRGEIAIQPLDVRLPGIEPAPLGVNLALVVERNRIGVTSAKLTTGASRVDLSGALEDLDKPHAAIHYDASVAVADVSRILHLQELKRGSARVTGDAVWPGGATYSGSGAFRAEHVDYRDSSLQLRNMLAEGSLSLRPEGLDLIGTRIAGAYVAGATEVPLDGQIGETTIRRGELQGHGALFHALGGEFRGEARLRNLDRLTVSGDYKDFAARRTVAVYSRAPLPWDAKASGTLLLETSLKRKGELRASTTLTLAAAPGSAPVTGQVTATYDGGAETLDLGHSTVSLPNSRVEFSGVLGREMRAHLETRDLNDLLPALGEEAAALPLKLENGSLVFDGTVTGKFDHPTIAGTLNAANLSYAGNAVDSLQGQATVSPENARLQNAVATRGTLRADFNFAASLADWSPSNASMIFGDGTLRNAPVADVASLVGQKDLGATGTLNATAKVTGTIGSPLVDASLEVTKGIYRGEPFDRLVFHANSTRDAIEAANGQLDAGSKQVKFSATYQHPPEHFDSGHLKFHVASNTLPIEEIETLRQSRPGVKGTAQVTADGEFELKPGADGKVGFRLVNLQGDATARGLQLTGQQLGNAHITARSQGMTLATHLDADFANSQVRGDGEWRMEGDYPGTATVSFTKLDFAQLRAWLAPSSPAGGGPNTFSGSAEGELHLSGPALDPEALKADLRLPKFELGPAPGNGVPGDLTVHNDGPIVVHLANNVVTIESAKLTGRDTNVSITGKASLTARNPLDLRADGSIGLGLLRDFDEDILAEGAVILEGTVRGEVSSPQISGRLRLDKAAFSLAGIPNGISKATGVILFNGDRATIQSLTGETGGGKIDLSGFMSYGAGSSVFRIHSEVSGVRVRYPEGVSTMADASLNLTGTADRSTLSGGVTILRTGFNLQSDFGSILASNAAPVQTPSARPGLLSGMKLDVQIETDPQIQFQSSLTQDLQVDANLRLRGTAANPSLSGRINITQGRVIFYGTSYTINQGSVAFYNPSKIEPILDIDLETKARGIDITLTVSGPLNKLNLTPRSDPPMQFNEIVQLLATGHTPSSDPGRLAHQTASTQNLQQALGSTVLGQAIASPVGRLQRLFGVSSLRIDPTLGGVENAPARVTLEQQVTPDITLTYITNITSGNPIVRVEWAVSKQWSVVALREENGVTGLDFFFKKRF